MKKKKIDKRYKFQTGDKAVINEKARRYIKKNLIRHKVGMKVTIVATMSPYYVKNYKGNTGWYLASELNKT